ncbi:unnamed protein product, partial [Urochloa humidicola]
FSRYFLEVEQERSPLPVAWGKRPLAMLPGRGQQPRGLGRPSPSSTPSFPTPELSCSKLFFSFFFPNSGKPRDRDAGARGG